MAALLALPVMAILFAIIAKVPFEDILNVVLKDGALRLHEACIVAIFGGMLAIFVKEKGIAETFIKYAAELSGDQPQVVCFIIMLASALLFTTLGGLGAIIMVGSIVLPILLSLGTPPLITAGIFLIGLCAGGTPESGCLAALY